MDPTACNYDVTATDENGSCTYPTQPYLNCDGACINDTDGDGVCNEIEVPGCTDLTACNFNEYATDNNGSCNYPSLTYYVDADGDGFGTGVATNYCNDPGAGFVTNNNDCDDNNAAIFTGATEICGNGIDEDCNGSDLSCPSPIAINDNGTVNEDESVTFNILINDDPNGNLIDASSVDLDPSTPGIQNSVTTAEGTWSVDGIGNLTFIPSLNFNGTAHLSYVMAGINGAISNSGDITVDVAPVNDAPVVTQNVSVNTPYGTAITICMDPQAINDVDGDNVSVTGIFDGPSNGVVTNVNDGDLCFTYTPGNNFTGVDSVMVTLCDDGTPSLCDTVWVVIQVGPTAPIANNDYLNSNNGTVSIDVVLNDQILGGLNYNVSIVDSTANGTLAIDGTWVSYTPDFGFCGTDTMVYSLCNAAGLCDTALLIIEVAPVDSDLDGISDYNETTDGDADHDGTPNYLDEDSDNDGVSDADEAGSSSLCSNDFKDCDQDGTPDYLDYYTCGVPIEVPEGFSPNADNTNDTWVIPGIEEFPDNTLVIFNRWGVKVFEAAPYNNTWDGTTTENTLGGNQLPDGTYFYVLKTKADAAPINGYVYIKR
jgi:gliding motility-associated-like protein